MRHNPGCATKKRACSSKLLETLKSELAMTSNKGAILLAGLLLAGLAFAGQPAKPELPSNPADLVRKAIDNEMRPAGNNTHYRFRLTKKMPERTETKEMIGTSSGVIGRLVALNGRALTPEQRQKEDKRLERLVKDPSAMAAKQKEQKDDDARTRKMVKALPEAFVYRYAGTEQRAPWGELVMLTFRPNPNFSPPSRELMVYKGMQGSMWIAVPEYRLAKIEANLFRDVSFGWGILGHLDSGGQFAVEQRPVANGDWAPTHMVLNFTGKVLLFKTIKIRQDETTSDYRQVPDMSAAQAVELLKKCDQAMAEKKAN